VTITTAADATAEVSAECDVVIAGSGAGGATVAAELAAAGLDVILVEEGGYHHTAEFTAYRGHAMRTLYRDGGGGMTFGRPSVLYAEGRCVGGSTVVNGGMSWRTPPEVLRRWASRESLQAITEEDLAPYFDEIEKRMSVGTQDPETIGRDSHLLQAGATALGWQVVANRRNQLHCAGTNNCNNGCPTGAKRSMLVTAIPEALRHGTRLYADCRVVRVLRGSDGRSVGLAGHFVRPGGRKGPALTVRARKVIVACGSLQTPLLLARSGIRHPMLGRNLSLHPNANLIAFFDDQVTGWQGVHQAFQVREFARDGIILTANNLPPSALATMMPAHGLELGALMADYNHTVIAGPMAEDSGTGRVRALPGVASPLVSYRLTSQTADRVIRGVVLTADAMFAAGARRVLLPVHGTPPATRPAEVRELLRDQRSCTWALRLHSVHLMGTARMSGDPRRGVTDSFGEVHGAPGVYVADASLFPGPTGLNPMETVIAVALRNARHLLEVGFAARR
jgi:choline dehydrogenase-like flavoprotein